MYGSSDKAYWQATEMIRAHEGPNHDTPIVAVTANAMKGDRDKVSNHSVVSSQWHRIIAAIRLTSRFDSVWLAEWTTTSQSQLIGSSCRT